MLLYRDVQWHYTGTARDKKGKAAASGVGLVRTTATHLMVFESPTDDKPSYTLACGEIKGGIPVNTRLRLKVYDLVFTRVPVEELGAPAQRAAAPAPLASSANALRTTGARTTAGIAAPGPSIKRKPTAVLPVQPPSSPPRAPTGKPPKAKRKVSTGRSPPAEPPKPPKRRRTSTSATLFSSEASSPLDNVPVASTSAASMQEDALVASISGVRTDDVAKKTSRDTLASMRVNPLTAAEEAKRQKYRAVMQQWTNEWVARAEARHEREIPVWQAASDSHGPEGPLFQVINGRIAERVRYSPPLGPDSPARQHISSHAETVRVLAGLASKPFGLPPFASAALRRVSYDPFVSDSDGAVLEPNQADGASLDLEDVGAQYYLRTLVFSNVAALRQFLAQYKDRYGDECWVAATLRSLELSEVELEQPVAIHYGGMTIRATPRGRVLADMQGSGGGSRCLNLLKLAREMEEVGRAESQDVSEEEARRESQDVSKSAARPESQDASGAGSPASNSIELIVHELVELRLPASLMTDANQPVIGDTEVALIAAIKPASFNSADGGRLLRIDPSALKEFTSLVEQVGASRSAIDTLAPLDPPLAEDNELLAQIKRALDDSIAYYKQYASDEAGRVVDPSNEGGRRAYDDILANMAGLRTRASGRGFRSFEFLLAKDITMSALLGEETFSSGENAARGPAAGYLIDRIVQGAAASDQGWRDLTASADLRAVILWHWLLLLALIFAIRVLHLAQPLLLVSHSGVINDLLRNGSLRYLLDPNAGELDAFLNVNRSSDPKLVEAIQSDEFELPEQREAKNGGWIATIGSTAVVRYGPAGGHIGLHISQLHPGFLKYNPMVQEESVSLFAAAATKTGLCRRVLAEHLVGCGGAVPEEEEARLAFFRAIKAEVERRALTTGIEGKLESARRLLLERYTAINSERSLAAGQRRIDADVDEEVAQRSANAKKAVANRSKKPVFVGKPLAKADQIRLEAYYSDNMLRAADLPDTLTRSSPRLAALRILLLRHEEAVLDGLISPAPELAGIKVGSAVYCNWFLSAPEGAELARSAAQVGKGQPREWTDEERTAYSEKRLAEEAEKRQAEGLALPGQLTVSEALQLLREDKPASSTGTTGRGSRRDVYAIVCLTCKDTFLDANFALQTARHGCAGATFVRVPVLFSSSLALLFNLSLLELKDEDLPQYEEKPARSLIPKLVLDALPFDPAIDPIVQVPVGTRLKLLMPLALDAILLTSLNGPTSANRVLSMGGDHEAWLGNGKSQLIQVLRVLLGGAKLATDTCPTCDKSSIVPADRKPGQHTCRPEKIEREGKMVKNRIAYRSAGRTVLPSNASLLSLGPERFRRFLYALSDSERDDAVSGFLIPGAVRNDAVIQRFLDETGGETLPKRLELFASRIFGWRQP